MARRVQHTVEGSERLRQLVLGLTPQKSAGLGKSKMGITSYIKVRRPDVFRHTSPAHIPAQTVLRNGVPFSPRRAKGGARAGKALQTGRVAHRMVEQFCKTGKLPPRYRKDPVARWVRGIATALGSAGIEPLRCEFPCALGTLRTTVDMLGMALTADQTPVLVCVEFSTYANLLP